MIEFDLNKFCLCSSKWSIPPLMNKANSLYNYLTKLNQHRKQIHALNYNVIVIEDVDFVHNFPGKNFVTSLCEGLYATY